MAQKITQALIYAEIVNLKEQIERHSTEDNRNFQELRALLEGTPSAPGLKIQVDRLNQVEDSRRWNLRTIWAAIVAILVGWAFKWTTTS